jgi:DNA repair exonuclease SbcCD ATPase subunit
VRFSQLKIRGISAAFPGDVAIDFDALGSGLIAIVGENGAGKSTLIGCLFASLFRQLPGQKRPLYDFATHPQPEIDVSFTVNGHRYRSVLKVNPQARQMESYLFSGDGTPLSDGKKESFQEAVQRLVGSRALYEASIFSNQKRAGNFLSLERAQRKEVFVSQLLGLGRLRRLSAMAKDEADNVGREITEIEGEKKAIVHALAQRASLPDPGAIEEALGQVAAQMVEVETIRSGFTTRLGELEGDLGLLRSLEANRKAVVRRQERVAREIAASERAVEGDKSQLLHGASLNGTPERLAELAQTIHDLYVGLEQTQSAEAANREIERAVQRVEHELATVHGELKRAQVECNELATVPCRGLGEFANCPKIERAVRSQLAIPDLNGTVATLELERQVHRGGLITVGVTSAETLKKIHNAEGERQKLESLVRQHQELRAVEARHAERLQALNRLHEEFADIRQELSRLDTEIGRYGGTLQERAALRQHLAGAESELRTLQLWQQSIKLIFQS